MAVKIPSTSTPSVVVDAMHSRHDRGANLRASVKCQQSLRRRGRPEPSARVDPHFGPWTPSFTALERGDFRRRCSDPRVGTMIPALSLTAASFSPSPKLGGTDCGIPNGFSQRWQLSWRLPGWRNGGWIGSRRSPPWNAGIDLPRIRALRRASEAVRAYMGKLPSQSAFPKTWPPAHPRGGAGVLFGAV
jgi:hypothetical protein